MTSPVQCMHPECMAASSGDDQPRCLKLLKISTKPKPPQPQPPPQPTPSPVQQRPPTASRQTKLRCDKCNDYPDGFRSEHELRRHTNRVHREIRKVWVTVDASDDKKFLANCKACQTGKRYNECYNAASHLRRMHFHPRKRGEGKGEKRGGAGSLRSEDPPMEMLKKDWLREVDEVVPAEGSAEPDDHDSDDKMEIDTEAKSVAESDPRSPT